VWRLKATLQSLAINGRWKGNAVQLRLDGIFVFER